MSDYNVEVVVSYVDEAGGGEATKTIKASRYENGIVMPNIEGKAMKHTREQLDKLGNYQLNLVIYKILFDSGKYKLPNECPDYCTDWSALMPLAVEYGIDTFYLNGRCSASDNVYEFIRRGKVHNGFHFTDKSPQRAIACCLIMVLESKDEHL